MNCDGLHEDSSERFLLHSMDNPTTNRYCLSSSEGEMVTLDLGLIIRRNEVVVVRRWAGGMIQGRVT